MTLVDPAQVEPFVAAVKWLWWELWRQFMLAAVWIRHRP